MIFIYCFNGTCLFIVFLQPGPMSLVPVPDSFPALGTGDPPQVRTWPEVLAYLALLWISFRSTRWILKQIAKLRSAWRPDPPVEEDFIPCSGLSLAGLGMSRFQHQEAVNLATFVTRRRAAVWERLRANSDREDNDILVLD